MSRQLRDVDEWEGQAKSHGSKFHFKCMIIWILVNTRGSAKSRGLISVFSDPPCYQNIFQTFSYFQNLHPHAVPVFFHLLVWAGGRGQCVGQDVGCPGCQFLHAADSWLFFYNCFFSFSKVIILRLLFPNSCQLSQELWKYIFGISASLSD